MLAFGTSAFLKLVCLNERPQRTVIRQRVQASGDGYDFHRSLRLRIQRHLAAGEPMADVLASIDEIRRVSERNSARNGLEALEVWRGAHTGVVSGYSSVTYESPSGLFRVAFTPDFGIRMGGSGVAVHVWNTKQPQLLREMTYGVLALFKSIYDEVDKAPNDLAVLSLPDSKLYRLSEAGPCADMGDDLAARIESIVREVRDELGLPDEDEHPPQPRP